PSGCLQYHRSITGTLQSFNTDQTANTNVTYPLRLNYGICIRQGYGFCSVQYSLSPDNGYFQMDSLINATENATISCDDSLIIPKASPQTTTSEDRYCGTNFPVITSPAHPFAVYVTSDDDPQGGRGFRLNFLQMPCRQ
uniref:CUB domain-containing protein n=1 Tax=Strigamia maritima TaxID=126957 RepID=T1IU91_STRMM